MKRICSLLLVLLMVFSLFPVTAKADNDYQKGTLDNELYSIFYEIAESQAFICLLEVRTPELVIPNDILGYPVVSVSTFDPGVCSAVTSIKFPDSLLQIHSETFLNCTSLTTVDLPSCIYLWKSAFKGCTSLRSIELPDNVTSIDDSIFEGCASLTSVILPDGVTSIGEAAFKGCSSLASIDLPESITSIEESAFEGCTSLASIRIPDGVTSIGSSAFSGCSGLTSIDLPDSITRIGFLAFQSSGLTSIYIPGSVTSIEGWAFNDCDSLSSITFADGVASIDYYAFMGCSSLRRVDIPASMTSIHELAFSGCSSLSGIYVDENNPNYSTGERGALFNKSKTELITVPWGIRGSYSIPYGVTIIGNNAFYGCGGLTDITIANSVVTIGSGAFADCDRLTSITIPASVTLLDDFAFSTCNALAIITFAGNAPTFGDFSPDSVLSGFDGTAYYPADNPTWTEDVMQDYGGNITWIPYTPNPFADVPAGSFYEEPVLWALENDITTGVSPTSFAPEDQCLRSQVVTFLHRAAKNPAPTSTKNPFTDVKTGDFFYNPVLWAVEKGITTGVSADRFGSYDVCNRAAVVTFLWRAAGSPEPASTNNPFTDVKTSDFFYKPVLWALENGITTGVDATHFGPATPCNRAQVVTFLYRAYN